MSGITKLFIHTSFISVHKIRHTGCRYTESLRTQIRYFSILLLHSETAIETNNIIIVEEYADVMEKNKQQLIPISHSTDKLRCDLNNNLNACTICKIILNKNNEK